MLAENESIEKSISNLEIEQWPTIPSADIFIFYGAYFRVLKMILSFHIPLSNSEHENSNSEISFSGLSPVQTEKSV